ncbi:MAG TPA: IrmA family protein [Alcaligenes sp.]|nr:IrmA family protein [Alcaligenes sp.]HRL27360.1 IrmA family protein [Alcaligenes sp.]
MKKTKMGLALCLSMTLFGGTAQADLNGIDFWHSDTVWANQGMCAANFTFDAGALSDPVTQLTVDMQVRNAADAHLGDVELVLEHIGGSSADRYATAHWVSEQACETDVKLVVTRAHAMVDGRKVDLMANKALGTRTFTPLPISFQAAPKKMTANSCDRTKFNRAATIADKDGYTNVRAQPNAESAVIEKIFENETFYTFQQKGKWWQMCSPSGQIGYMYHNRVRM